MNQKKDAFDKRSAWEFLNPRKSKPKRITEEGQPCRHCRYPVRKKVRDGVPKKANVSGYYFAWWFVCSNYKCRALYMVEDAKRWFPGYEPKTTSTRNEAYKPIQHGPDDGEDQSPPW